MATNSGRSWVAWANTHAKNSTDIDDLESAFKVKAKAFIDAMEAGGATVSVSTTKRSDKRAYLFHWSWKISLDKCTAAAATTKSGVDITWDHGDAARSKAGALEMVTGFGLAVPPASTNAPSLTSNHISGKAIDMTITWTGTIKMKKKDGSEVSVTYMNNVNNNVVLHTIGESYGVKKLITDKPHWSHNGR